MSQTSERRRREIVDGLIEIMAETGYQRATVQRIANAAGLAPGLLHYHFQSKREILLALAQTLEEALWERYQDRLGDPDGPPYRKLLAFLHAHVGLGRGQDGKLVRAWLALQGEALFDPELGSLVKGMIRRRRLHLLEILEEVLRGMGRDPASAPSLVASLLAALDGALWVGTLAPGVFPRGSAYRNLEHMVTGLLAGVVHGEGLDGLEADGESWDGMPVVSGEVSPEQETEEGSEP